MSSDEHNGGARMSSDKHSYFDFVTSCRRVVGQDRAVDVVSDAVLRSRAGLAARNRGSSFLFLVSILLRSPALQLCTCIAL